MLGRLLEVLGQHAARVAALLGRALERGRALQLGVERALELGAAVARRRELGLFVPTAALG